MDECTVRFILASSTTIGGGVTTPAQLFLLKSLTARGAKEGGQQVWWSTQAAGLEERAGG
jgi:hypothetical protein